MSVNLAFFVTAKNFVKSDRDTNLELALKKAILQAIKDAGRGADSVEISGMAQHMVLDPAAAPKAS